MSRVLDEISRFSHLVAPRGSRRRRKWRRATRPLRRVGGRIRGWAAEAAEPDPPESDDPREWLWYRLQGYFMPDHPGEWYAGPDIEIGPLPANALERAWVRLLEISSTETRELAWYHNELEGELPLGQIQRAARAKLGVGHLGTFYARLYGIRYSGVELPSLGVWMYEESLALHWWVEGWSPETAAALVELLVELRSYAPGATMSNEWPSTEEWNAAVDAYVETGAT